MKTVLARPALLWAAALALSTTLARGDEPAGSPRPIKALLVTGGCCHDYDAQKVLIPREISARARVEWTVVQEGGTSTDHKVSIYQTPGWSRGYDVVVHNECFSGVNEREFVEKVVAPHRNGVPAVMIHCAVHTFSSMKSDEWRECLGVTSRRHGPQQPLEVKRLVADHPIMKGFPAVWTTGPEELYAIEKVWPGTVPLAQAYANDNKKDHPVIWTNTFGEGRVFGTTLAHHTKTMSDPAYLDMLTRGLLWACNKLNDDGLPKAGYEAIRATR